MAGFTGTRSSTLNTLYATTWQARWQGIKNQVFTATPFFYQMTQKGRRRTQVGGAFIEEPLEYAMNTTVQTIGRGGTVTLQETDPLTTSYWQWKYLTGHIIRFFVDWQKNSGKSQIINRVANDISNLRKALIDYLNSMLFGDGTGNGGLDTNGMQNLVAFAPTTGTVGGINRATYSWWRNRTYNATGLTLAVHLRARMNNMWNTCGQLQGGGSRFPTLVVTTQALYEEYDDEADDRRIFNGDQKMIDLGVGDLMFKGRPIVWDEDCPAYAMYFLNTDSMSWVVDPRVDMKLGEFLPIPNQPLDVVAHNMTACNLVMSCPAKNGVIYNLGN